MAARANVYEIQDDLQVKTSKSTLRFTKKCEKSLYIVTTQRSFAAQKHIQHGGGRDATETFHVGISYTVLTVVGRNWELRLILNPKEISEIFSKFNFIGFLNALLTSSQLPGKVLLEKKQPKETKKTNIMVSKMAAQFLSSSANLAKSFSKKLTDSLKEKWEAHASLCREQKDGVGPTLCIALLAVIAAMLARDFMKEHKYEDSDNEDDEDEEEEEDALLEEAVIPTSKGFTGGAGKENHENIVQQFEALKQFFKINENLMRLSQNHKNVYVVTKENIIEDCTWDRNPKLIASEETVHFGINHKVLRVCSKDWEVQLLQNLNRSFDVFTTFNMTGFADCLLMSEKWKNKLNLLLENKKEKSKIIMELSQLAATFMCDTEQQKHRQEFMKKLKDTLETKLGKDYLICSNTAGNVATALFGTVLVLTASLLAKGIMENPDVGGEASTPQIDTLEITGEVNVANTMKESTPGITGEGSEINTAQKVTSGITGEGSGDNTAQEGTPGITGEGSGANTVQDGTPRITGEGSVTNTVQEATPGVICEGSGANTALEGTPGITGEDNGANTFLEGRGVEVTPGPTGEGRGSNTLQEGTPGITGEGSGANIALKGTTGITGEGSGAKSALEFTPEITGEGSGANTVQEGTPGITGEGSVTNTVQEATPGIICEGSGANTALERTPVITGEGSGANTSLEGIPDNQSGGT